MNQVQTFGWWSIDPATGIALGKMELGGAQAMTEMRLPTEKIAELSHIFAKFYGGLLGCHMMAIADTLAPPKGPYEVLDVPGLPKIKGGEALAACVITKTCEFIAELSVLALSCRAFEYEAKATIERLTELVVESWISEKGAEIGCHGAGGGGHG